MRLVGRDERWVTHLVAGLRAVRLDGPNLWADFLPALKEALRAEVPLAYAIKLAETGPRLSFFQGGKSEHSRACAEARFDSGLIERPQEYTAYDPVRVERGQRNRVKVVGELAHPAARQRSTGLRALWKGFGVEGYDQIRVLACEDPPRLDACAS